MTRSKKRGKEARYERAVRRQVNLHTARPLDHAPAETVLRDGDTSERFAPAGTDDEQQ